MWRCVVGIAKNRLIQILMASIFIGALFIFNDGIIAVKRNPTKAIGYLDNRLESTFKTKIASTSNNENELANEGTMDDNESIKHESKNKTSPVADSSKLLNNGQTILEKMEAIRLSMKNKPKIKQINSKIKVIKKSSTKAKEVKTVRHFQKHFKFVKDHPEICGPDKGKSLPLLIIVTTAVNKIDSRDAIRSTWGGYAKSKGAKLVFLIGKTKFSDVQNYVSDEDQFYKDIIQADFVDNYVNLTLKTVTLMKWVSERCSNVPYVLKTDDDMLINVNMMMDFLKSRKNRDSKSIFGKVARRWKPHRETNNKWFVSAEEFNGTVYPDFTTGPAYLFTGDSAKLLYEGVLDHPFLFLEDVLLTGIVAQEVGVKRYHHRRMKNTRLKVTYCLFKKFMTSHKHTPEEIESLWEEVTKTGVVCPKNPPRNKPAPPKTKK